MSGLLDGITPSEVGLPPKFSHWRDQQVRAIEFSLACDRRFVVQAMPTGTGKSAVYMAEALVTGPRTVILTSTKGLQDQLTNEFSLCGLVSVKGRNSFDCGSRQGATCEDGPIMGCKEGSNIGDLPPTCPYMLQYLEARRSQIVVTNYAYWCAINRYREGLGPVDLLICDEAHDAPEAVCSTMACEITPRDLDLLRDEAPKPHYLLREWIRWARSHEDSVRSLLDTYTVEAKAGFVSPETVRRVKALRSLASKLKNITEIRGDWVVQQVEDKWEKRRKVHQLSPLWAKEYAEQVLWCGVPKVMMVSATILPKTLELLGVKREDMRFQEYLWKFPVKSSPVYFVPTVRSNYKNRAAAMETQVERVDEIVGRRLDRRGIIHTTSYDRAREIVARSRYRDYMVSHDNQRGGAVEAALEYRGMEPPAILVTPSMSTGYDFPYEECEYQIVLKAPYPDHGSELVRRRVEQDQTYGHYVMAQELVQACGRGMRADDDQCETFIIDDTVERVMRWKPGLFPQWFRQLWRKRETVPPPLNKLIR
jgi:ATP-dependent DNA helicase DinG